ncbi:MAG: bifunctional adenosylcobinamide kinase/adenosylcobinamide-phosphate guanylyltransferase [Clostridia bacterium]
MKLIIGGVAQGKLDYVLQRYGLTPKDIWPGVDLSSLEDYKIINNLQLLVAKMLENGRDAQTEILAAVRTNPHIIIIAAEIGCGIVPIEQKDRIWREVHGRLCCELAKEATEVIRIFCGRGMVIKS